MHKFSFNFKVQPCGNKSKWLYHMSSYSLDLCPGAPQHPPPAPHPTSHLEKRRIKEEKKQFFFIVFFQNSLYFCKKIIKGFVSVRYL